MFSTKEKSSAWQRVTDRFFNLPGRLKRPILFALIVLIVIVPVVFYGRATHEVDNAAYWVAHTEGVKEKTYEVLYDLRDADSAARTCIILPDIAETPKARKRVDEALNEAGRDLDDLQKMTDDSMAQQERIGRLRAIIEGRGRVLRQIVALMDRHQAAEAKIALHGLLTTLPFRDVSVEITDQEDRYLDQRTRNAEAARRQLSVLIWSAAVAQLALFFALYVITEKDSARRRRAEQTLAEASAYAQSMVETNPDPLVVLNGEGRVRSFNKAFAALYGADLDRSRGELLWDLGGGAWQLPALRHRVADMLPQEREIWDMELVQQIGGERRNLLANARPFPSRDGQRLILLAVKDVTAHKRTEEQITQLNRELTARVEQTHAVNQELEAFSYSVSHDLRAPLRHITGFADMLNTHLARHGEDEKTARYLKYIRDSAAQMGTLIDDLLVFSRMGRTEMAYQEVDMEELVHEAIRHFGLETEGRKVEFTVGPLPSTRGDAAMLRQVWVNLISNAIKYSRRSEPSRIEIGSRAPEGAENVYYVRDNGVGFNMKYAHKLFGVFQRLHQAEEYEGTGIGLANVRRIVQRHGGRAWAEGEVGHGAVFSFSIPFEPRPVAETFTTPLSGLRPS